MRRFTSIAGLYTARRPLPLRSAPRLASSNNHNNNNTSNSNDDSSRGDSGGGWGAGLLGALRGKMEDLSLEADRRLDAQEERLQREMRRQRGGHRHQHQSGGPESGEAGVAIADSAAACPRSVLFMPGSKPRAMAKMYTIPADCFILDLEDSVGPGSKREARENIRKFMLEMEALPVRGGSSGGENEAVEEEGEEQQPRRRRVILRINSPDDDTTNALLDLELAGELGPVLEGIAIPKVTPRTHALIADHVHPSHSLWAFFESASSVLRAGEICAQGHYRCAVMGHNDLAADLCLPLTTAMSGSGPPGLEWARRLPLLQASTQVLLAARANGLWTLDAVFNDPSDTDGLRAELALCRAMGFDGKTLIHPAQVAPTNAAYTPTAEEVAWAQRVVEAVARAEGGVATVDGKMVEELHVRQARRLLSLHASRSSGGDAAATEGARGRRRERKAPPSRQTNSSTST